MITVLGEDSPSIVSAIPPLTKILPLCFLIAGVAFPHKLLNSQDYLNLYK